jgi:hypothetical protein
MTVKLFFFFFFFCFVEKIEGIRLHAVKAFMNVLLRDERTEASQGLDYNQKKGRFTCYQSFYGGMIKEE